MAGKTKPGSALKGINIKLKMINDLMDVTGSAKDSWNPAEISDDMKAIAYIHRLADTWNPAQLNEALKYLGFATIDSWNPAIIEETKNKLVKYFLPTETTGNPITFNAYGNLPYEVSKAEVTFLPKQSGSGEPSPDNVRPIIGWTEVNLKRTGKNQLDLADISGTETNAYYHNISTDYKLKENVTYTLSFDVQTSVSPFNMSVGVGTESGSYSADVAVKNNNSNGRVFITFTPTQEQLSQYEYLKIRLPRYASQTTFTYSIKDIQLELGSTATAYEPYQGETYTEALGSTVYGGKGDFVSGKFTITYGEVDLGNLTYTSESSVKDGQFYSNISSQNAMYNSIPYCENYKGVKDRGASNMNDGEIAITNSLAVPILRIYDSTKAGYTAEQFATALSGVKCAFELKTPTELTLTPTEIELLKGQNVILTDGDDILIEYKALLNS